MAWDVDDIIKVTVTQSYLDQTCINTYWYQITVNGGSGSIINWLTAFTTDVLATVRELQDSNLYYTHKKVENITDEVGIYESPMAVQGLLSGTGLPSYVAGGIRKFVADRKTRGGSLRLAGMTEEAVGQNEWNPNTIHRDACLLALAASVNNGQVGADELEAIPIIYGILKNSDPVEMFANPITSCGVQAYVTTQNSRKQGVGE